jgi:hypothetical protein
MYQFTTTNVINSSKDSSGIDKFKGDALWFDVRRVNKYLTANITQITKQAYSAPVLEVATITTPTLTAGKAIRLEVKIGLSQNTNSEYASSYLDFEKPVVVEVLATGTAATDASALTAAFNRLKNRFGYNYATATVSGATITFTAKDEYQRFDSIIISEETVATNSIYLIDYVTKATGTVTTAGKVGFGTDAWMIRAVRIPTYANTRQWGEGEDERPVIGGKYSEFVIHYSIDKPEDDGIVSGHKSVTTGVFWVKSDLVSDFETELAKTGLPIGIAVTADKAALANDETTTVRATGNVGAVVWTVQSGTSATVDSSSGVVTAHSTNTGDTVIRGTDALGNYADVTITVS